jgi:hypothetical protein
MKLIAAEITVKCDFAIKLEFKRLEYRVHEWSGSNVFGQKSNFCFIRVIQVFPFDYKSYCKVINIYTCT